GANRVFCFATFGLFTNGPECFDEASKAGVLDKVFTTNLVYRRPELATRDWYVEVNMCKYVAYLIDTLNNDETISALLNPVKRIQNLMNKHRSALESQMKIQFEDHND
ncbi:MAG: ribose-phosphate pyrophosphokinase, partial [Clostridia bacterium]|nr:ribose-phosphate pyrophosphokinase [Clostridia bacterium]